MMAFLRLSPHSRVLGVLALAGLWLAAGVAPSLWQGQAAGTYTIYSPEGRRSLSVRATGSRERLVFSLAQLGGLFGLKFTEDFLAGGLIIETRGERIISVPGQSFVQVAGKIVSLDGPIERDGNTWQVPFDFLQKALGPAVGQAVVVRRPSRLILVGDVRVPQITGRVERTATGGRVVLQVQPAAPRRVLREGTRLVIRFDAVALDATPISGAVPDFITGVRIDGVSVVVGLGPSAVVIRGDDDRDLTRVSIELLPPPPRPPPLPSAGAPVGTPLPGITPPDRPGGVATGDPARPSPPAPAPPPPAGGIRTVVIDPGHGGADTGVIGSSGAREKDLTLDVARRLKTAIEGRLGLRVLLTRDGDDDVGLDARSALANYNKADLFVSLHANAAVRPELRGVQVLSLGLDDYPDLPASLTKFTVPTIGGGTRSIGAVPWDLAQVPFATRSAAFGAMLAGRLNERGVPLHPRAVDLGPVRVLAGAHMPAVMVELGFLTHAEDEAALTSGALGAAVVDALVASIADMRLSASDLDPLRTGR